MPRRCACACMALAMTMVLQVHAAANGDANTCGGTARPAWKIYDEETISIDIDTIKCGFTSVPNYVVSVEDGHMGPARKDDVPAMPGSLTIAHSSASSIQVFMWDPKRHSGMMLDLAIRHNWLLTWIGDSGSNSAVTVAGMTGWQQGPYNNVIYADIDTTRAGFGSMPIYFASLHGSKAGTGEFGDDVKNTGVEFWHGMGASTIYSPTPEGFRVYVTVVSSEIKKDDGRQGEVHGRIDGAQLVRLAEKLSWTVSWIGVTSDVKRSGFSHAGRAWMKIDEADQFAGDLYSDVSTHTTLHQIPAYTFSVSVSHQQYAFIGPGMLTKMHPGGFRVIVADIHTWDRENPHFSSMVTVGGTSDWQVNYFVAHPYSAARNHHGRQEQLITVHARLTGESHKTLSMHKQHQLSLGLAAGLHLSLHEVQIVRMVEWSDGVVVQFQLTAPDKEVAKEVVDTLESPQFPARLSQLMEDMRLFDPRLVRFSKPDVEAKNSYSWGEFSLFGMLGGGAMLGMGMLGLKGSQEMERRRRYTRIALEAKNRSVLCEDEI